MVESLVDFGIVMVSCLWFYWRPGVVVIRSRSSVVGDVAALVVNLDDELDGDVLGCVGVYFYPANAVNLCEGNVPEQRAIDHDC